MADQKLTALPLLTEPADEDLLYTVNDPSDTPTSKKITWTSVKAFLLTWISTLFLKLVELSTPLTFGGTTAWNFNSQYQAVFTVVLTADLVPVISNVTNLRSAIGKLDITNEVEITLNANWKALSIPDSVAYASNVLTITPPLANTIYILGFTKFDDNVYFNIQEV
jgi:hypothetical protein